MSSQPDPATVDEALIKQVAFQARGDVSPMNAVFGGLVAQEVLKVTFSPCGITNSMLKGLHS